MKPQVFPTPTKTEEDYTERHYPNFDWHSWPAQIGAHLHSATLLREGMAVT